jgi:hypothetical protein
MKKTNIILLALCCFINISWVKNAHPIKISTSIITYTNNEVSLKLYFFADDFGAHLQKLYEEDIDLEKGTPKTITNVLDYINNHYILKINNKKLKLEILENSFKDNVFQISFKTKQSIKYAEGDTKIELKNTLLLEAFDDQSNIVRIDLKGEGNYETLEFEAGNEVQKITI